MEPNDDLDLRRVLREWQVPDAPASLHVAPRTNRWPTWLSWLTRDIRVPVPVAIVLGIVVAWLIATGSVGAGDTAPRPANVDDLRGFEPVNTVNVRIERRSDAPR